jgi:hypothetical protein
MVAHGVGPRGEWVELKKMIKFCGWIVVMVQQCECTSYHCYTFKMVSFMSCVFYCHRRKKKGWVRQRKPVIPGTQDMEIVGSRPEASAKV